jgi:hypothetical protein
LYKMRAMPEQFTDDDTVVLHELLVYSTIEMMRALHLDRIVRNNDGASQAYLQAADGASFQDLLSNFGADGARNNRGYSACGLAIAAGELNPDGSPQSVFGGLDDHMLEKASKTALGPDLEDEHGSLTFECPHCKYTNRRRYGGWVYNCYNCKGDVSCGRKKAV